LQLLPALDFTVDGCCLCRSSNSCCDAYMLVLRVSGQRSHGQCVTSTRMSVVQNSCVSGRFRVVAMWCIQPPPALYNVAASVSDVVTFYVDSCYA